MFEETCGQLCKGLQQQIVTLKGEKTSLQQQILGLQRRVQEIEEQEHYQGQLQELKKTMVGDVQRLQDTDIEQA
eukprot:Skav219398  [mRNA]  locus=scaffold1139:8772:11399:+ [translate_table: standard]